MNLHFPHVHDRIPVTAAAYVPATFGRIVWPARNPGAGVLPARWLVAASDDAHTTLVAPAMGSTVWLVERGRLELELEWGRFTLGPGTWFATEAGERVQAIAGGDTRYVVMAPPAAVAAQLYARHRGEAGDLGARKGRDSAEPALLADCGTLDQLLAPAEHAALVAAVRERRELGAITEIAADVLDRLLARQREAEPRIARTAGRTRRHRRLAYARLARTRLLIEHGPVRDYTMCELAQVASMSVWHYVRSFGHVFGETPHRCFTRQRLARAASLLRTTDLSISAIVATLAFENRCSFARLFARHHGQSASAYRARHRPAALPSAAAFACPQPRVAKEVRREAEAARH